MPLTRFKLSAIADGGIETADLADGAVTTPKIENGAVTLTKTNNLFQNTEISGTEAARMPVGTTAERANAQKGDIRFNSTINLMEYYDGTEWKAIDAPPTISSVSPSTFDTVGDTITITGTNFQTGLTVKVIDSNGTQYTPDTVTRVSSSSATFDITSAILSSGNDYFDVKVTNVSGLSSTIEDSLSIPSTISMDVSAGSLGTITDRVDVASQTLSNPTATLTGESGDVTVTYSISSGSIPSGLSFNTSTGAITGTPDDVGSSTTSSFDVTATYTDASSSETGSVTASYTITVNLALDGSTTARAGVSGAELYAAGATTGTKYVKIGSNTYQLAYEATDKFSTGDYGWVKVDDNFYASNTSQRSKGQTGTSVDSDWVTNGFYLGDANESQTAASHMGWVQMNIPDGTNFQVSTMTGTGSGSQDPDDARDWSTASDSEINSYVALKTPTSANPSGYAWAIWNGSSSANLTNGGIKLVKLGDEYGSQFSGTNVVKTNANLPLADFGSEIDNPKLVCWTGDSGAERIDFTNWDMWIN